MPVILTEARKRKLYLRDPQCLFPRQTAWNSHKRAKSLHSTPHTSVQNSSVTALDSSLESTEEGTSSRHDPTTHDEDTSDSTQNLNSEVDEPNLDSDPNCDDPLYPTSNKSSQDSDQSHSYSSTEDSDSDSDTFSVNSTSTTLDYDSQLNSSVVRDDNRATAVQNSTLASHGKYMQHKIMVLM